MRLYFCAFITLVEMPDTSFVNAVIGKIMDVFGVSYDHISNLYSSIAIGACISLPLTKYCYHVFN